MTFYLFRAKVLFFAAVPCFTVLHTDSISAQPQPSDWEAVMCTVMMEEGQAAWEDNDLDLQLLLTFILFVAL